MLSPYLVRRRRLRVLFVVMKVGGDGGDGGMGEWVNDMNV